MSRKTNGLEERIRARRIGNANDILVHFQNAISNINVRDNFADVVDQLIFCEGLVITTGMGKAGIIMRKFSSTLCSLGMPSVYLHPGEAMHGDLGIINKDKKDILFIASTSGKTKEILELVELTKKLNLKSTIGLTSHPDSPIRNKVDYLLDMGVIEEAGTLKLSPTTSTLVMLAITDTLAIVAAEEKGFTKGDFAKFHHGGYIGGLARGDNIII
jgi:arabinose-5-phosphate isomerase